MAPENNIALRVSQLDAAELDGEVVSLTKAQLSKLFKYHQTNFLANFEPEISAGIKLLIWKFSISASASSIGQKLLNLKYFNEHAQKSTNQWISRRQQILYACLLIGCPWLKERSHDIIYLMGLQKWKHKLDKAVQWLETGVKMATLINFLVFLNQGMYLSIIERLLGIRSVFPERQMMRQVTFEYMTRELLWHGFSELLFFILPLVNFRRIKNFVAQRLLPSAAMSSQSQNSNRNFTSCAVCGEWPIRTQEIGCMHVFCYFCIQSNFKADPGFRCPLCAHPVDDQQNIHHVQLASSRSYEEEEEEYDTEGEDT